MQPNQPPKLPVGRLPSLIRKDSQNTTLGGAPKKLFVPSVPTRTSTSNETSQLSASLPGLLKSIERKTAPRPPKPAPSAVKPSVKMEIGQTMFAAKVGSSGAVPFSFSPVDELKPDLSVDEFSAENNFKMEEHYQPAVLPFVPVLTPLPQDSTEKPVYHEAPTGSITFDRAAMEFCGENFQLPSDLFLIQFPPCLPCNSQPQPYTRKGAPTTPIQAIKKEEASQLEVAEAKKSSKKVPKPFEAFPSNSARPFKSTLSDTPAGHLGKLRIHKSGKMYLSFPGGIDLPLSSGADVAFDQKLVSITVKSKEDAMDTASLIDLGSIQKKLLGVIVP
ncbi:hypothetical protein RCL1_005399 [Eukaryota sp. TZLM3-RCL]